MGVWARKQNSPLTGELLSMDMKGDMKAVKKTLSFIYFISSNAIRKWLLSKFESP